MRGDPPKKDFPKHRAATALIRAQGSVLYRHGFSICNVSAHIQTSKIDMVVVSAYAHTRRIHANVRVQPSVREGVYV